jgi:hypothetical protein
MANSRQGTLLGFIVGMSRAGTQWMARGLGSHPETVAFGETQFWGKKYVEPSRNYYTEDEVQRIIEGLPGVILSQGEPKQIKSIVDRRIDPTSEISLTPKGLFDRICQVVAASEGKSYAVEKTPHHINHLGRIAEAYPKARFVVMARSPYEFMRSYKHQGDRKPEDVRQAFKRMYHPVGCALVYRGYARSIRRALHDYPTRTLQVTLGDVKSDAEAALEKAQRFFGLEASAPVPPPTNSSFPEGESPSLDAEDLFWMNTIAGWEIQVLGYEMRNSDISSLDVARSAARVPRWGGRALSMLWAQSSAPIQYVAQWLFPGK